MKRLCAISSSEDHCCLATPHGEDSGGSEYILSLCNSLGTTVDSKQIPMEPIFLSMTNNYVFAANRDYFYTWHFRTAKTWSSVEAASLRGGARGGGQRGDQVFHVDDNPSSSADGNSFDILDSGASSQDPICCLAASDKVLMVGRESGLIQRYSLPNIALTNRYNTNTKPFKMDINCNLT